MFLIAASENSVHQRHIYTQTLQILNYDARASQQSWQPEWTSYTNIGELNTIRRVHVGVLADGGIVLGTFIHAYYSASFNQIQSGQFQSDRAEI